MITIKKADASHLPAICDILNEAIKNTYAVWSEELDTLENRTRWMATNDEKGFPILIALDDTQTVHGFGAYGSFRSRSGYDITVEHSVYVSPNSQGQGVGKALLKELIRYAHEDVRLHKMIAAIDGENTISETLHAQLGFETQGLLKGVATKWNTERNLLLMVKDVR